MSTRDKLLGRINNKGHYTCIFCTIKDGKFRFDIGERGRYSWDRYAPKIGVTAHLVIEDIDTDTYESRNLDLITGQDNVFISYEGNKPIKAKSIDIYNEFQRWIKRSDVVAVASYDGAEYIPVKVYEERIAKEANDE